MHRGRFCCVPLLPKVGDKSFSGSQSSGLWGQATFTPIVPVQVASGWDLIQVFPGSWYFILEWNKGTHRLQSSKDTLFIRKFYWMEPWRRDELVSVVPIQKVSTYLSVLVMTPRKRPSFRVRVVRGKPGLSLHLTRTEAKTFCLKHFRHLWHQARTS